jgi:hypothetical protein
VVISVLCGLQGVPLLSVLVSDQVEVRALLFRSHSQLLASLTPRSDFPLLSTVWSSSVLCGLQGGSLLSVLVSDQVEVRALLFRSHSQLLASLILISNLTRWIIRKFPVPLV